MKVLLVEDKEPIRKGLLRLLELIDVAITVVGECESVKEALIVAKACKPDLVFLDINLTDGTGFDFWNRPKTLLSKLYLLRLMKNMP
ncbi:LytR/AlgR family response regulator transcription factor [Maribacter halichondriae]|uniref:LytR/AlgR family response regulator transcription factor n=1 Tax=Maribacter halichondriae TaxID=2980554 RepID=UPI002358C9D2|nr:response regulator [Maribacter sp. Hal144]